ncbi:ribosome silencing factor [Hydrogenophaga sp.]|uniref:ribosome silencing factor n=1 Tax=Hydrogenophaga sp. TaxID=1904254 RepID=UPI002716F082|nr:ribosome silencing factor [Hydrogenophaga sp.]MDO9437467.1 ribosome silencing factor [Hydrogenophaga sp.]
MTSETTAKKDIQRLQRAIVDGLEDVKGQDIVVFNTEHLSPLFERVIIASGTSNRQTKALASSVRDAVREAGFDKPRIEGEENGEWIIVDCGAAVAHVMQPVIRQYYRLEEIWGATPVRLKHGAVKPEAAAKPAAKKKAAAKKPEAAAVSGKTVARKAAAKNAPAPVAERPKRAASKTVVPKRAPAKTGAVKTGAAKTSTAKLVVGKPAAKKAPTAKKTPVAAKKTVKTAAKKKA